MGVVRLWTYGERVESCCLVHGDLAGWLPVSFRTVSMTLDLVVPEIGNLRRKLNCLFVQAYVTRRMVFVVMLARSKSIVDETKLKQLREAQERG